MAERVRVPRAWMTVCHGPERHEVRMVPQGSDRPAGQQLRRDRAAVCGVRARGGHALGWRDPVDRPGRSGGRLRRHLPGDHGGLSPPADSPLVSDLSRRSLLAGGARHAGGRRLGDQVGGRPPQAPRLRRRGRRPAQPHTRRGPGVLGRLKGLWHAHVGWLFNSVGQADQRRYAPTCSRTAACA